MIFTYKRKDPNDWHRIFAFTPKPASGSFPVKPGDKMVWLEFVERRAVRPSNDSPVQIGVNGSIEVEYEYKRIYGPGFEWPINFIEFMIIICILGILSAIAIPAYSDYTEIIELKQSGKSINSYEFQKCLDGRESSAGYLNIKDYRECEYEVKYEIKN